ncbi:MAG: tRNA-dihydrouridine synthase [Granulosicoccus sp.]
MTGTDHNTLQIVLAPMEGVIDAPMRARLTSLGGYSRCVTEFIRVTDVLLPQRVFQRLCPELAVGGCTPSGVPVYVQLLGSNPAVLAANACRAANLGARGIDLNFGCPAKTVNKSQGGSILLRRPEQVADIVRAVRDAVPANIPVTAKIRLGYDNSNHLQEIVEGIRQAGVTQLAIHARTKYDGYKPPAHWSTVSSAIHSCGENTLINGEIWSIADAVEAQRASGCRHLMLGRGALAAPDLARRIQQAADSIAGAESPVATGSVERRFAWLEILDLVEAQFHGSDCHSMRHVGNRTKQWLAYLKRNYPEAKELFGRVRTLHDVAGIAAAFLQHRDSCVSRASGSAIEQ